MAIGEINMKKVILTLLSLLLLLTSVPNVTNAGQKGDDKGEVLNLPPFVDFEVKEKRKVDVIVDVGNTSKTLDEVNSLVNLYLRPKLQAEGLDYNIVSRKTGEGKPGLYLLNVTYDGSLMRPYNTQSVIYFDFDTQETTKIVDANIRLNNGEPYSPTHYLYISPNEEYISLVADIDGYLGFLALPGEGREGGIAAPTAIQNNDWSNREGWRRWKTIGRLQKFLPDGRIFYVNNDFTLYTRIAIGDSEVVDNYMSRGIYDEEFTYNRQVNINVAWRQYSGSVRKEAYHFTEQGGVYVTTNTSIEYYSDIDDWIKGTATPIWRHSNRSYSGSAGAPLVEDHKTKYEYLDYSTGDLYFVAYGGFLNGYQSSSVGYGLFKYDLSENKVTDISKYYSDHQSRAPAMTYFVTDDQVIFYSTKNSTNLDTRLEAGWYTTSKDKFGEETPKAITGFDIVNPTTFSTFLGSYQIKNKVYKPIGENGEAFLEIYDLETFSIEKINLGLPRSSSYYPRIIAYPEHVLDESVYMRDVIEETELRSDADKYYIRIDDSAISQLKSNREKLLLANELINNNFTYIALGNEEKNMKLHESLLDIIDNKGMFLSNENMQNALSKAAAAITNKKEADIHVLIGQESISLANIKSSMNGLIKSLQSEGIFSSVYYHQGTAASTTYELLNKINWREDRNNYVVMFNRGAMSELSNSNYLDDVANELMGYYSHYLSIGTTANRAVNQNLIAANKGNGVISSSTNITAINKSIYDYVKSSAVKNPKRVTDTLVLNYDRNTGRFSSDILINTYYEDFENDPKYTERFKTTHDPSVYENHMGLMEGIGQYQDVPTTTFTKVGKYEMVVQVQDNPSTNAAFANYRQWSLDSLSRLVLFVHRAPVAEFTATVNKSRVLTLTDLSYDLDKYSLPNRGIVASVWKWKKAEDKSWTDGSPPTTLAANTDYYISLKVRDIDRAWSSELIKMVSTKDSNQNPVALFTVDPQTTSWNKNFTLTDKSYDPDGDAIVTRSWKVMKDGVTILTKGNTPTSAEIKQAAASRGMSQLGQYHISLQVQDALGAWSEWYSDFANLINNAPIADFDLPQSTYRDSMNTAVNKTANPDADGDNVTYRWRLLKGDKVYSLGATKDVSFRIRDRGLGKDAVGTWSLELRASDPLGAESYMTKSFQVLNQKPITEITSSPPYAYIDEKYSFTSSATDPDSEDVSSLKYFWKLTMPSGKVVSYYTKNLSDIMFSEKGPHVMEHWVQDQLDDESEIVRVQFNVLNKLPIADFTRTPITTYRGVDIDFKSLGTDYDGWIESMRFELLRDNQLPLTLSTMSEFTRSFSSVGTFDIRHTVTDNDGASDSIIKQIHIINRAPKAEVTDPSGTTAATATEYNTLTPIIRWTMTDADNDPQVQYQLQLKNQAGTVLRTTNATTTINKTFTIPTGWLTEGSTYRVSVRVFDGYDWSEYSADKYFYVTLNRPPKAGFTSTPAIIYEGDTLMIKHAVDDLDLDTLSIRYTVTAPNGQKSYYPSATSYYNVSSKQYSNDAFSLPSVLPGNYIIEQSVTDSKSEPVKLSRTIPVAQLGIVGQVTHTKRWEEYRNAYNESLSAGNAKEWLPLQFYSGERFMLSADTTLADHAEIGSTTYAVKVTALLQTTGTKAELSYEKDRRWSGSMWDESFISLTHGNHTFTFNVQYSNGVIKQHDVEIEIIGKASDLIGVHRWK